MIAFLKFNCAVLYLMAGLASLITMPWRIGPWLQTLGLALLAIHLLELPFFVGAIRKGPHPAWRACLETLLFGVLYWLGLRNSSKPSPLEDRAS